VIVLWGLEGDSPLAMVGAALGLRGAPLFFLNQAAVLESRLEIDDPLGARGTVSDGSRTIALESARGVYLRPFDTRRLPAYVALPEAHPGRTKAIATDDAILGWCETATGTVVNRPSAMGSNNSKPYQAALIAAAGFEVPDTLVTNDAEAVRAFRARHGRLIYKSTSGIRSIVATLGDDFEARVDTLATCPTQFQAYVPGRDIRVHVVGPRVFATEIQSDADDYRYGALDGRAPSLAPFLLPPDLEQAACDLTRALGLEVSGIDLRLRPDGRPVCFEVNPSPGFSFYEGATGQPIAAAIADLLIDADEDP
jgi:glutathione synthase/RimK-type ligase-like ATP-grasp enzyme